MPEAPKRITGQRPPVGEEANWNWAYRNKTPIEFQGHTYLITGMTRGIPPTYVLELQKPAPVKELPRCATCKHWKQSRKDNSQGNCNAVVMGEEYPEPKPPMFILIDYYETPLETRPDFGCVLHEPKEGG